jgi:spore maturation protein SpmB
VLLWKTLVQGLSASFLALGKIALILFPLLILIEIAKELGWLDWATRKVAGLLRRLELPERAALPLAAGIIIGLTYSAGILLGAVKEKGWTERELTLLWIFLGLNHAIIEDTAIFAALGIPALAVLLVRLVPTVLVTWGMARVLKSQELTGTGDVD